MRTERTAHDLGQFLAFLHFVPIAHVGAAHVLFLVEDRVVDMSEFLGGIFVGLDVVILAGFARGLALVPGAGAQRAGDDIAELVGKGRLDILHNQRAGELRFLDVDADNALDRGDAVTGTDVAEQFPVVAGVEAVDAGQTPAGAADPAERHREVGVGDNRAIA